MLETNIPLAAYTDTDVAADTGISITVQQITTEADAPVVQLERGDPDGDGAVSVQDAVLVLTYYAKKSVGLEPKRMFNFSRFKEAILIKTASFPCKMPFRF